MSITWYFTLTQNGVTDSSLLRQVSGLWGLDDFSTFVFLLFIRCCSLYEVPVAEEAFKNEVLLSHENEEERRGQKEKRFGFFVCFNTWLSVSLVRVDRIV